MLRLVHVLQLHFYFYIIFLNLALNSWKYLKSFSLCWDKKKSMLGRKKKLSCIIIRSIIIIRMNLYLHSFFLSHSSWHARLLPKSQMISFALICVVVVRWRIFDNGKIEYYAMYIYFHMYKWQKNWRKLKKGFSVFLVAKGWVEGFFCGLEVIEGIRRRQKNVST